MVRVKQQEYRLLDGSMANLIQRVGDGSIVNRFDKTPSPLRSTNVVCPHFLELKWAYGCPYNCAWCYLKGTFRFLPTGTKPIVKSYDKIESHLERFLGECGVPEVLNTGEIADSLMHEGVKRPFSKFIIPIFESQGTHKVLFVTKSDNVDRLLEINPHNQVIVSFSLNADEVAKRWEKGAPTVEKRVKAARRISEAGYEVRIRIDPIVPVPDWEKLYADLIGRVFDNFVPSRITLGSLRGLQSTVNGCTDRSWLQYLKESSNWGKRIDCQTRYRSYAAIIRRLEENHHYANIALCKETVAVWLRLGMDYKRIRCNCTW